MYIYIPYINVYIYIPYIKVANDLGHYIPCLTDVASRPLIHQLCKKKAVYDYGGNCLSSTLTISLDARAVREVRSRVWLKREVRVGGECR